MNNDLLNKLDNVNKIACSSKWSRLFYNPYKYINAILFRKLFYAKSHKEKVVNAKVFFGGNMTIALPASTDIYLTGGKSHDSEIRLARFLIKNLQKGDHFIDIGAHYGYFTLLGAKLVGDSGKVYSFEPAADSFDILSVNCKGSNAIKYFNEAVSDANGEITFYQFPNMYSEYNALDIAQFENEDWFQENKPKKVTVKAKSLDTIINEFTIAPKVIKIDVEGAEDKTIKGGESFFKNGNTSLVMEYLSKERGNDNHKNATQQLYGWGYKSFTISNSGDLLPVSNIDMHLLKENLESDNIVFKK